MISCTGKYSPNYLLYCITTDPFRKGFCHKKGQVIVGCDAHAPEKPDAVPLLREKQSCLHSLGIKVLGSLPGPSEPLYFAEKSAILKLSEGIL